MYQAPAFAAYSFRDEEMGRVWMEKRRWVELHELHVDDARPRPIGNGHPITARPSRIGRTQENLPESSSRQHGMPCHAALHLPRGLVQHIRPHAGQRVVDIQAVQRVVGWRQQVNGRMPDEQGDIGMGLQGAHQRCADRFAGGVSRMDDAGQGVPAFEGEG